jgi:hypothetical protein
MPLGTSTVALARLAKERLNRDKATNNVATRTSGIAPPPIINQRERLQQQNDQEVASLRRKFSR